MANKRQIVSAISFFVFILLAFMLMGNTRFAVNDLELEIGRCNPCQLPELFGEVALGAKPVPVCYLVNGQFKIFQVLLGMGQADVNQVIMDRSPRQFRKDLPEKLPVQPDLFHEAVQRNIFPVIFVDIVDCLPHLRGFKRSDVTSNRHR